LAKAQSTKIMEVAPILKELAQMHELGTSKEGVEALNNKLMQIIDGAGLLQKEKRLVDNVGVHPGNREKTMLVPIDVQDLLLVLATNGFNPKLWNALAATVSQGPEGEKWRQANIDLVNTSCDMLAPLTYDALQLVTGRGSHGTAALRAAKFGCKAVHPNLAGADGQVSVAKILELQPSLKAPLLEGVAYDIIPGELCVAVPGLFECLSRLGVASNDSFRLQTVLQHCNRIHNLATSSKSSDGEVDWQKVVKVSSLGMPPETA